MPDPPSSELPSPEGKESSFTGKSVEGIASDDFLKHRSKLLELVIEARKLEQENEKTKREWRPRVFWGLRLVLIVWLVLLYLPVFVLLYWSISRVLFCNGGMCTLSDILESPVLIAFISSQTIFWGVLVVVAFRWLFGERKEKNLKKEDILEIFPQLETFSNKDG